VLLINRGCCVVRGRGVVHISSRVSALCCAPCRTTGHNDAQPQAVLGADPSGGLVAELVAVCAIRPGLEGALPRCDGLGAAEAAGSNGWLGVGDAREGCGAGFRVPLDRAGGGLDGPEVTGRGGALCCARLSSAVFLFSTTRVG